MEKQIEFLYKAIEDAQRTIRIIDTKAGFILVALGIITPYLSYFANTLWPLMLLKLNFYVLIEIILGISSLSIFLAVALICFKAINPLSSPVQHINTGGCMTNIPFYLWDIQPKMGYRDLLTEKCDSILNHNVSELAENYRQSSEGDIIKSLSLELAKLSYIREKKIFRVNKSISLLRIGILLWLLTLFILKINLV